MKKLSLCLLIIASLLATSTTASAQPQQKKHLSPWLIIIGATTAVVGVAMMLPAGDNYTVLDQPYCVNTYPGGGRVDSGACQAASSPHTALWVIGAGGAMMAIGMINVTVRPTRTGVTAAATVKWGGK